MASGAKEGAEEKRERQHLVQLVKIQAKEVEALKLEIKMLRRKGGHVYSAPARAAWRRRYPLPAYEGREGDGALEVGSLWESHAHARQRTARNHVRLMLRGGRHEHPAMVAEQRTLTPTLTRTLTRTRTRTRTLTLTLILTRTRTPTLTLGRRARRRSTRWPRSSSGSRSSRATSTPRRPPRGARG